VPSSTSSSNSLDRLPAKPWGLVWAVALALAIAMIGGMELFWRARGATPSVNDDAALWAYHRRRLDSGNPKTVVLLGASRMQLGFSTDTFRRRYPNVELVNLSVAAATPLATLCCASTGTTSNPTSRRTKRNRFTIDSKRRSPPWS
jgi:hypothetical protein